MTYKSRSRRTKFPAILSVIAMLQQRFFQATANSIAFIGLRVFADVRFPTVIRPDDLALPSRGNWAAAGWVSCTTLEDASKSVSLETGIIASMR